MMGCIFVKKPAARSCGKTTIAVPSGPMRPITQELCRVVWDRHVKEMTDLDTDGGNQMMRVVFALEQALIQVLGAEKVNLASLGNQVPHLHWHVIPRFKDDPHFPFCDLGPKDARRRASAATRLRAQHAPVARPAAHSKARVAEGLALH